MIRNIWNIQSFNIKYKNFNAIEIYSSSDVILLHFVMLVHGTEEDS